MISTPFDTVLLQFCFCFHLINQCIEYVEDFFFRNLKPQGIEILPWYMTSLLTHQDGLFISILFPLTSVWAVVAVALIVCFQNIDSFSERRLTSSPSYCFDNTMLPKVSVTLIDKSIELILSSILKSKPRWQEPIMSKPFISKQMQATLQTEGAHRQDGDLALLSSFVVKTCVRLWIKIEGCCRKASKRTRGLILSSGNPSLVGGIRFVRTRSELKSMVALNSSVLVSWVGFSSLRQSLSRPSDWNEVGIKTEGHRSVNSQ